MRPPSFLVFFALLTSSVLAVFLLTACDGPMCVGGVGNCAGSQQAAERMRQNPGGKVWVVASAAGTLFGGTVTFKASGGKVPYHYVVVSGGGTVTETGGVYTAPWVAGTVTVRATDQNGSTGDAAIIVSARKTSSVEGDLKRENSGGANIDFTHDAPPVSP